METLGQIVKRLRGAERSQEWLAGKVPTPPGSRRPTRHQTWIAAVERGVLACSAHEFAAICNACNATDEDRAAGVRAIALRAMEGAGLTVDDVRSAVGAA